MTLVHRILALGFGWRSAHDADDGTLVVYHEAAGIHFSGPGAWYAAVIHSCRNPEIN